MIRGAPASQPAPATRPASTGHDVYRDTLEYNRRTLAGAYRQVGKRDPKWDAAAEKLLEAAALHFTSGRVGLIYLPAPAPTREDLLKLAKPVIDAGCDDPLVLYCYAAMLQDTGRRGEASPVLRRAFDGLLARKYPPTRIESAAGRLAASTMAVDEVARLQKVELEQRVAMACSRMTDGERRIVVDRISDAGAWGGGAHAPVVEAIAGRADADPWVRDVLAGRLHVHLAWQSRGGGWANTVTEDGWKGFFRHLGLARDAYTRAWKLAPHLPEPAAEMITVCMGGGDRLGEREEDWFGRALAAQVDYEPAYTAMLSALQPRWGGSYEAMMDVGTAAARYPRFDTYVPWQLIRAARAVGTDAGDEWRLLQRSEPAYAAAAGVLDQYVKAHAGRPMGDWFATCRAALAWRVGRLDDARKRLDALGARVDPRGFRDFGAGDPALAIAEVYARSGPHAAALAAAERKAADEGDAAAAAEALAALEQVAAKLDAKDPARPFVADRLRDVRARVELARGEWVSIQPSGPAMAGWEVVEGRFEVDPTGGLVAYGAKGPRGLKSIVWTAGPLGRSFEIAGRCEFLEPEAPRGTCAVVIYGVAKRVRGHIVFDMDNQMGGASFPNAARPRRLEAQRVNDFVVRCVDGVITVEMNGKPVLDTYHLTGNYAGELQAGVGGVGPPPVRFTDLRVRRLDGDKAAGALQAPPEKQ